MSPSFLFPARLLRTLFPLRLLVAILAVPRIEGALVETFEGATIYVDGSFVAGSPKLLGQFLAFDTGDMQVAIHKRMVPWWGNSVVRVVSVYIGGVRLTVSLDERLDGPHGTRPGYAEMRLGFPPGLFASGYESVYTAGELGDLVALETPLVLGDGTTVTYDGTDFLLTRPNGDYLFIDTRDARFLNIEALIADPSSTSGWVDGDLYITAPLLNADVLPDPIPVSLLSATVDRAWDYSLSFAANTPSITSATWDLDGDGEFDDASTLAGTHRFSAAGPTTVQVKALSAYGFESIAAFDVEVEQPSDVLVDGLLDGDPYGPPFAVQNTATSFGDNTDADTLVATGSELDALYARISGDSLYLLLTGNLETNFNKLELFIDSVAGGQNTLLATNPVLDFDALGTMAGLTFDAGFAPDYFLTLGGGDAGSGITFFVNFAELYVDGANPGSTLYLGETGGGNTTFPVDLASGGQIGIDNSNTAGVSFTELGNPAAVTTGIELRIPLSLIGDPAGAIKVTAFVNSDSHNFLSNQVLPGIGAGLDTTHLGPPPVDFSAFPGDQFATIASYDVETLKDAGPGSLRQAIANASPGSSLTIAPRLSGGTITLSSGQLLIDKDLTIDASTLPDGLTIDANHASRVIEVALGATVILDSLILTGGAASDGGGLYNRGTVSLIATTVSGNTAGAEDSNSIHHGGGIFNEGTLTVEDSSLSGNVAIGGGAKGGGLFNAGDSQILRSTVSGNLSESSSGSSAYGGGIYNEGTLTLRDSTVADNLATPFSSGGGIWNSHNLTVENATISGNIAGVSGGGIVSAGSATFVLNDSIVAGNSAESSANLTTPSSGSGNFTSGDPMLAPLGDYGGPTQTMPPLLGSPAIDAGDTVDPDGTDQRGFARLSGPALDIGAVELQEILVDTTLDENDGIAAGNISLRDAIAHAVPGEAEVIRFDPAVFDGGPGDTITLAGSPLEIGRNLAIDASDLAARVTIDAGGASRVLEVSAGTVVLDFLTFTGGFAPKGAGILNSADLTLQTCIVTGNVAENGDDTNFSGEPGGSGGGIYTQSNSLVLIDTTVAGNRAGNGGNGDFSGGNGGSGGGLALASGTLEVKRSTISGNRAGNGGSGSLSSNGTGGNGGGLAVFSGSFSLTNTTLAGNFAGSGGSGGGLYRIAGTGALTQATVSGNTAALGGGIGNAGGSIELMNSIVTGNSAPTDPNVSGSVTESGSLLSGDSLLAPLGDWGGPTQTMLPLPGSPAIDGGNPLLDDFDNLFLPIDQRGLTRVIGDLWDIGSVETGNAIPGFTNPIVTSSDDVIDGIGAGEEISLREAIDLAQEDSTITFDPALSGATITLTSGRLSINRSLTIDASMLSEGLTIDANGAVTGHRVMHIARVATVLLDSLSLKGGNTDFPGGGILNSGTLTVLNSTLSGNSTSAGGGGIWNQGTLTIQYSTLSGNSAGSEGGGIFNNALESMLTIENSTLCANTANTSGGGIFNYFGTLAVNNSTLSGNAAPNDGGGIYIRGGSLDLEKSIVAENTADTGSDIFFDPSEDYVYYLRGVNMLTDLSSISLVLDPILFLYGDPRLAPLGDYGGPTQTMPPLPGSPAIDAGDSTALEPIGTDQRGFTRISGAALDLGAVELQEILVDTAIDEDDGIATGDISLRDAIAHAVPGEAEIIRFDPTALDGETILLGGSELLIERNLEIDGSGLPHGITIDAQGGSGVFNIASGISVALDMLTVTGGNTSSSGGGIRLSQSTLYLRNSTISGNTAFIGGGISNSFGTLSATNVTLANNVATAFGGGLNSSLATNTLQNVTLVGNSAVIRGGGINSTDTLTLISTIVANNEAPAGADLNYDGSAYTNTGSLIGGDPLLAPLGDYGGPTETMPPLPGSPAIDAGGETSSDFATDQRGLPRVVGGGVDIGAVESGNAVSNFNVVNSLDDAIDGAANGVSLREAVTFAPAGATLTFDPLLDASTLTLTNGQINIHQGLSDIGGSLTIDASALPGGFTISGASTSRHFEIEAAAYLALIGLTLIEGSAEGNGGSILNAGNLTVSQSTFSNNTATGNGGAIEGPLGSQISIRRSSFNGNSAADGGAIAHAESTDVYNSTFFNNAAVGYGGAIFNYEGNLTVESSTLTGNAGSIGGGISLLGFAIEPRLQLGNSIVSANTAPTDANLSGSFVDSGPNLLSGDPRLAPLGAYGGPTSTMPPLPGSPVIETGIVNLGITSIDQIGNPRKSGNTIDIGAVEALPLGAFGLASADGDTIPDLLEGPDTAYPHLDPLADDSALDTDGDGSTDAEEFANMTDLFDGTDYFRVVAYRLADACGPLSDPTTDPVVTITLSTFPGLSYAIEAGGTLLEGDYLEIPSATFTANDFEATLDLTLPPGSEFIRAKRED
jgi:predicted outer membrane repeat protein